jgi:hypothetical protein
MQQYGFKTGLVQQAGQHYAINTTTNGYQHPVRVWPYAK